MLGANVRKGDGLAAISLAQDEGTQRLVADLMLKPPSHEREIIVLRALLMHYHDDRSPYALPEITLMRHLRHAGFCDLIQNAVRGKYDQPEAA